MNLETKKYTIEDLMELYLKFCQDASFTQNINSEKFGDFIGWLTQYEVLNK